MIENDETDSIQIGDVTTMEGQLTNLVNSIHKLN